MFNRRRAFQLLALGGAAPGASQDDRLTLESVRGAAIMAGLDLREERLKVLLPILENRRRQLRDLRAIRIEDHAGPPLPTVL